MSEIKSQNNALSDSMAVFFDQMEAVHGTGNHPEQLSWYAPFMGYCDPVSKELKILPLSNSPVTFVVPLHEFSFEDWPDQEGMKFQERMGFGIHKSFRGGVWRQLTLCDLCEMIEQKIRPFHPAYSLKELRDYYDKEASK